MAFSKINVLVFPCGAENGCEIFQSLRYSLHVKLFGATSIEDHGRFAFDNYIGGLPSIHEPGFDEAFVELVRSHDVQLVFPTHDTVAEYLAPRASGFGIQLVNGDPITSSTARRKSATYHLFSDCPWTPDVFSDLDDTPPSFPIVVKPDRGQGGQGVTLVHNRQEAFAAAQSIVDPLFVEYLPGKELTVDCFTDRFRRLVWIGPRTRERVRAGISMRSARVEVDDRLRDMAQTINTRLTLRGPWFFQVKQDAKGQWKLLEVACRVAGSMVFQRARGINLPLMAVHDFMERDLLPLANPFINLIERNIATRAQLDYSFDHVFVDLDDTLIMEGKALPKILAFLHQCANEGKSIHLITRHPQNPAETLQQSKIAHNLFDSIIHLTNGQPKSDFVYGKAIFIDNHFPERLEVAQSKMIPVFDTDAVELFLK